MIIFNDNSTPRDFVPRVLMAAFRMTEAEALGLMLTASRYATEPGRHYGYPLAFTTGRSA